MRIFVAFRTVFGGRELRRIDERRGFRSSLAGQERVVAERQVIGRTRFVFRAGGSRVSACQYYRAGWKQQSEKSPKAWWRAKAALF